jgi:DNA-binding NtrC family response regulator
MTAMPALEEWMRPRILVVDDYDGMRVVLGVMVHRLGFEPVSVASAAEGLEALGNEPFAAVLSDFDMPGGDGLELLRDLRARGDWVPFVLMSAELSPELAAAALRSGATLAVAKHEMVESLPAVLERVLSVPTRRSAGSPSRRSMSRPSPSVALRTR